MKFPSFATISFLEDSSVRFVCLVVVALYVYAYFTGCLSWVIAKTSISLLHFIYLAGSRLQLCGKIDLKNALKCTNYVIGFKSFLYLYESPFGFVNSSFCYINAGLLGFWKGFLVQLNWGGAFEYEFGAVLDFLK